MKRLLLLLVYCLVLVSGVQAAQLPYFQGPLDPSSVLQSLNSLIASINTGVGGLLNSQTAAVGTGLGTTEQTLQQYTMPPNTLSIPGQAVRITCWGKTGATNNNKTHKLYFGNTNTITSAADAANAQPWFLQMTVMYTAAANQSTWGWGMAGTGGVTPLSTALQGNDSLTAPVVIKCTGTDGTSQVSDITALGMTVELIK